MILYLTYNDQPSGVYWSQVTDVVAHLNSLGPQRVRLFALVSARGFLGTRRRIKQHSPDAIVWPMVPQMKRWKWNTVLLVLICLFLRPSGILARGVFGTWMALRLRKAGLVKRVGFDGRGAYAAEWEEYRLIDDETLIAQFRPLENAAVNAADIRLAVTEALVGHWRDRYGYTYDAHIVVPCTLGASHALGPAVPTREGTPFGPDDVVLVYSGSTAGWQSFGLLETFLGGILDRQAEVKVLFLSKADANNAALQARYPGRVFVQWLEPAEVARMLAVCDHGIMVREDTITNRVASPTKFGEYLAAGLPVITSAELGDCSGQVRKFELGLVYHPTQPLPRLTRTTGERRAALVEFAQRHYTKPAFDTAYMKLLGVLGAGRC